MIMETVVKEFLKLKRYKPTYCIDLEYNLADFLTEFQEFTKMYNELEHCECTDTRSGGLGKPDICNNCNKEL